jgi:predicted phage replisome organizer
MSDNKNYYYLKLKENFFDGEEIKLLESMENGYLYSNILLKMYLRSLKSEGRLMFRDNIPYNAKMLSTITGHNIDVIEKAIKIFVEFKLIQILDSGAIYIADLQSFIGESSTEADRKRVYRLKIDDETKRLGQMSDKCPTNVGQTSDKYPPELELELELKKEIYNTSQNNFCSSHSAEAELDQEEHIVDNNKKERKRQASIDYDLIIEMFNCWCARELNEAGLLIKEGMPRIDKITDAHKASIKARIKELSPENDCIAWETFVKRVASSDFLMGKIEDKEGKCFNCNFFWILKPKNFAKIINGNYDNRPFKAR